MIRRQAFPTHKFIGEETTAASDGKISDFSNDPTWDRFYKTPFRPKAWRINFRPPILSLFLPKKYPIQIYQGKDNFKVLEAIYEATIRNLNLAKLGYPS
jgi:hypothetical protein